MEATSEHPAKPFFPRVHRLQAVCQPEKIFHPNLPIPPRLFLPNLQAPALCKALSLEEIELLPTLFLLPRPLCFPPLAPGMLFARSPLPRRWACPPAGVAVSRQTAGSSHGRRIESLTAHSSRSPRSAWRPRPLRILTRWSCWRRLCRVADHVAGRAERVCMTS